MSGIRIWAERSFGGAALGDVRRTRRLVRMAQQAALQPGGRVTEVFARAADRQAAYDFLEHDQVPVDCVREGLYEAAARASHGSKAVLVVLDGTSLALTDDANRKNFGHIGSFAQGATGLKVLNALALTSEGCPIGVADQIWWSRHERVQKTSYRRLGDRESTKWRAAVERTTRRFAAHAPGTRLHFIADREGDATQLLRLLVRSGHEFTIRSNAQRKVMSPGGRQDLRRVLRRTPLLGTLRVELPSTRKRESRTAHLDVRAAHLPIVLKDKYLKQRVTTPMTVVWAVERTRRSAKLEWVLFTNRPVENAADAIAAVRRYTYRWRIEDFHRSWKSGVCRVENTQLRSINGVIKWATILAAVASRAERLKHLCRETPDALATIEFSTAELEAVAYLKNEGHMAKPHSTDDLTLAVAVRWIADLGGYVGNRGSGRPGATTIARGLERVVFAAELMTRLRADGRLR